MHLRNGRIFVRAPSGVVSQMVAAQFSMLELLYRYSAGRMCTVEHLNALMTSCQLQADADVRHHLDWSYHFLA
jgi:hypothetical protein